MVYRKKIHSEYYLYNKSIAAARAYFIAADHQPHIENEEEVKVTASLRAGRGGKGLLHAPTC